MRLKSVIIQAAADSGLITFGPLLLLTLVIWLFAPSWIHSEWAFVGIVILGWILGRTYDRVLELIEDDEYQRYEQNVLLGPRRRKRKRRDLRKGIRKGEGAMVEVLVNGLEE